MSTDEIGTAQVRELVAGDTGWITDAARLATQHVHTGTTFTVGGDSPQHPLMTWDSEDISFRFIQHHAWELLRYSQIFGWGLGDDEDPAKLADTFALAVRWLAEVCDNYGFRNGGEPTEAPEEPEYEPLVAVYAAESFPLGKWPNTAHLRLHYLADMGGGWICTYCGIDLVDTCRDDDMVTDPDGRRLVRPGCKKRMPSRDHIVPQDMGGSHGPQNLALACQPCNSRKGAA